MRPRGTLGANLHRMRGSRPVPPEVAGLLEAVEAGRVVPSEATLDALGRALGLGLPARGELEECRRVLAGQVRAGRFRLTRPA